MSRNEEQINIARVVYDAYPHSDLLPIEPERDCYDLKSLLAKVTGENIGDGLFTFMVVEIVEGGESTLTGAIRVIERARADVEAVLQALRLHGPDSNRDWNLSEKRKNRKEKPYVRNTHDHVGRSE